MPKAKQKQEPPEINKLKLHPCWAVGCGHEMNVVEQEIAQVRMVCPACGAETHAWFYASQAEQERQDHFKGTYKGDEGEKQ